MGQQQLLLIVLGLIIIGVAIVVGINLFKGNAVEVKRNNIIDDCLNLATLAQQHYKIPGAIGGGNNSYDGSAGGTAWTIPSQLVENANGHFQIQSISRNELKIFGDDLKEEFDAAVSVFDSLNNLIQIGFFWSQVVDFGTVGNIFPDRFWKRVGLLENHPDPGPQQHYINCGPIYIFAVKQNGAGNPATVNRIIHPVKATQKS